MRQQQLLPLWDRVVFVDWHGVLSLDPFWKSMVGGSRTRLKTTLQQELDGLFASESSALDSWMRGILSLSDVTPAARGVLGHRRRQDFLERRFSQDCLQMDVHPELFALLISLSSSAFIVVATDNAAEFEDAFWLASRTRVRGRAGSPRMTELASKVDDVLCSGTSGVLKAERPALFFGGWLASHGLAFSSAMLLDDRIDNCDAFQTAGGNALVWPKSGDEEQKTVLRELSDWASRPLRTVPVQRSRDQRAQLSIPLQREH